MIHRIKFDDALIHLTRNFYFSSSIDLADLVVSAVTFASILFASPAISLADGGASNA